MKLPNLLPEFVCLMLFTLSSSLWVISLKENISTDTQLNPLSALEQLIPQHKVELLNANFSDQQHYDQLAQLQSEVEALIFRVDVSDTSEQLLKDYIESSLSYIQLTSMLKTSQRLISENTQLENTQLTEVIDDIRLKMFSFISTSNRTEHAALMTMLNGVDINNELQPNRRDLQLVKLHSLFVLENYELTATYRQKLIGLPVVEIIILERSLLQRQIRKTNIKKFAGIFGTILGLVLLFIVVIKRHEYALINTAERHKEFATNLMDMLGNHGGAVQTALTPDDDGNRPS